MNTRSRHVTSFNPIYFTDTYELFSSIHQTVVQIGSKVSKKNEPNQARLFMTWQYSSIYLGRGRKS